MFCLQIERSKLDFQFVCGRVNKIPLTGWVRDLVKSLLVPLIPELSNKLSRIEGSDDMLSDSDSCLRNGAAPSLNACAAFSIARLLSTSCQRPVWGFFSRNLPGGLSSVRTLLTMDREIIIFCFFVQVT